VTVVAVQHVPGIPERERNVDRIREAVDGWASGFHVVSDFDRRGPQWSWRQCLARVSEGERLLVVQDDVELVAPMEVLDEVVRLRPTDLLCLSYPRKEGLTLSERGVRWMRLRGMWVYATVYPPGMPGHLLQWVTKHIPEEYRHDDRSLSAYMTHHALYAYAPLPSLAQHLEYKSTLGHGNLPHSRAAKCVWVGPVDYGNLRAVDHRSRRRRTVAEIKQSLRG
jgi:hypothetical protein